MLGREKMDAKLKPMIFRMAMKIGGQFGQKDIDIRGKTPGVKILAHVCDAIIAEYQEYNEQRMIAFWKAVRNSPIQIYENDSAYSRDMEIAFRVIASHPEIFKAFAGMTVKLRKDLDLKEEDYHG
jgi:hypothetical protein